jgi:molybdopterin biosynthesis enzyme
LSSVSKADGFILIPEEVERIEEGTEVEVVLYR